MNSAVVVLAAGASSRFGTPKQLAMWRGRTLLRHAVEEALAVCSTVIAVIGADADRIAPTIGDLPCQRVVAANWHRGPGASIKAGILALPVQTNRVLVTLVDLPLVDRFTFRRLFDAPGLIVASAYAETIGVPAVFDAQFFGDLNNLAESEGAKVLLRRHHSQLSRIESPEAAYDVDTPEALLELGQQFSD